MSDFEKKVESLQQLNAIEEVKKKNDYKNRWNKN